MGQREQKEKVIEAYLRGGVSLRELGQKHGIPSSTIHRWVKALEAGAGPDEWEKLRERVRLAARRSELPVEVRRLQKELEEAKLYNELLNAMIDIAEEQMGIDIRKKSGAKRR